MSGPEQQSKIETQETSLEKKETHLESPEKRAEKRNKQVRESHKLLQSVLKYHHGKTEKDVPMRRNDLRGSSEEKNKINTLYLDKDDKIIKNPDVRDYWWGADKPSNKDVHRIITIDTKRTIYPEGYETGSDSNDSRTAVGIQTHNLKTGDKAKVFTHIPDETKDRGRGAFTQIELTKNAHLEANKQRQIKIDDNPETNDALHPDEEKQLDRILKDVNDLLRRVYDKNVRQEIEDHQVKNDQKEAEDLMGELEDMYT